MSAGQAVQRLAGEILLNDLALEGDAVGAVGTMLCHGRRSFECPTHRSNHFNQLVRPQGPTPKRGQFSTPNNTLIEEGPGKWIYQIVEVNLVTLSDAALLPEGLDARFHEGAALAREHCLRCHMVNGYGGEKHEGNLAEITKNYEKAAFVSVVLAPRSVFEEGTMPALSARLAEDERERIAKTLFDYLSAIPVLE